MTLKEYYDAVKKLNIWSYHYYYLDDPIATDDEYDTLYKELREYEELHPEDKVENTPTNKVGGPIQKEFAKYQREDPMLSLDDVFNQEELTKWLNNIIKKLPEDEVRFCCSPKYDGCSLEVLYESKKFSLAATRGNKYIGEDVSLNATTINTIPLETSLSDIGVRGEVVIKKSVFEQLNKNNEFSNPRNLASGSLRQLNPAITRSRRLDFIPWGVTNIYQVARDYKIKSFYSLMEKIYQEGKFINYFNYFKVCSNVEEVIAYVKELEKNRDNYPVTLDGCVITIDNLELQMKLGFNSKTPRFSIAYKLPPTEKVTYLKGIEVQIGRSGVLTPVGILQPVNIDGRTISKVTLHNYSEIINKDLRIGDQVILILSGDVIPKITKVLTDRRTGNEIPIGIPVACPICNTTNLEVSDKYIKCNNYYCSGQVIERINHFIGKNGLDVKGLSSNMIATLVNKYDIKDPYEFYYMLNENYLVQALGEKIGKKLHEKLEISKTCSASRFISALGIPHIGSNVAKIVASALGLDWNRSKEDIQRLCPTLNKNSVDSVFNFDMAKCLEHYTSLGFEVRYG